MQSELKGDRFIPNVIRPSAFQMEYQDKESQGSNYERLLGRGILDEINQKRSNKIMTFSEKHQNNVFGKTKIEPEMNRCQEKKIRKISKKPYKTLEAPNLQDDFYLNLLDWSDHNQIAIGLDTSVYLWSGCSSEITRLYETKQMNDYICSLTFCDQNKIAVGNSQGQVRIFDIMKNKKVHSF